MISPKNKTTTKDANNNRSANKKKQHQISAKRTKNLKQQIVPMKNNVLTSGTATSDGSTKTPASILQEAGKGPHQNAQLSLSSVTSKLTFSGNTTTKNKQAITTSNIGLINDAGLNTATPARNGISATSRTSTTTSTTITTSTTAPTTVAKTADKLVDSPSASNTTTKKKIQMSAINKTEDVGVVGKDQQSRVENGEIGTTENLEINDESDELDEAKRHLDFNKALMTPKSTNRKKEKNGNTDSNNSSSNNDVDGNSYKKDSPLRTSPRLRSSSKKKALSSKSATGPSTKRGAKGTRNASKSSTSSAKAKAENTGPPMEKDDTVTVLSRTWPGVNKPGGAGRIWKVNDNGTYDIKYLLGGSERGVEKQYITLTNLVSVAVERKRRPRTIYDPDTMEAVVPALKEKQAEEERERRSKEKAEKAKQREIEKKQKAIEKKKKEADHAAETERKKKLKLEAAAAKKKKQQELLEARKLKAKGKPGPKKGSKRKDHSKNNNNISNKKRKNEKGVDEDDSSNDTLAANVHTKKAIAEDNNKKKKSKKKRNKDNISSGDDDKAVEDNEDEEEQAAEEVEKRTPSTIPGRTSSRKQRADAGKKREKYTKRKQPDDSTSSTTTNKKARTRVTRKGPILKVKTGKDESKTWEFATPRYQTDFPNIPLVGHTEWPIMPEYILDNNTKYISSLVDATTVVAVRSAETPAPFIRPPTYPEGWTATSLSASMTSSYQNMVGKITSQVRDSYISLNINTLTPLGRLKYKRCVRRLSNFRVEHDRLRVLFLESIRQCKRRYLCKRNGSLIPGAMKLLDMENNVMARINSTKNNLKLVAGDNINDNEKDKGVRKFEKEIENIEKHFARLKNDMLNRQQHELNIFLSSQWHQIATDDVDKRTTLNNLISDGWISRYNASKNKNNEEGSDKIMNDSSSNNKDDNNKIHEENGQKYNQNRIVVQFPYELKAKKLIEAL